MTPWLQTTMFWWLLCNIAAGLWFTITSKARRPIMLWPHQQQLMMLTFVGMSAGELLTLWIGNFFHG